MKPLRWGTLLLALICAPMAHAHVGSPDVYAEGQAGPYKFLVVVRPPLVIPGVADVEVRSEGAGPQSISITPIPMAGEAAKHPPVPEAMTQSKDDAAFFTGHLWMMSTGSWQIRLMARGVEGDGVLSIPVPATATGTRPMTAGLQWLLAGLGLLLLVGMVGIMGAAAREAKLPAGMPVTDGNRRRGWVAMGITLAALVTALVLGNAWWKADAASYSNNIYKPLGMAATLNGGTLDLKLHDPGWIADRKLDDFIPDHDHLMHLYVIRWPAMDVAAHLHPQQTGTGEFQLALPSLPAGDYHLYADVVHEDGFPETIVGQVSLPAVAGRALEGDDAVGTDAPVSETAGQSGAAGEQRFKLQDGYTLVWSKPAKIAPKTPLNLQFALLDKDGKAPKDMALYMGMLGHAAFVKTDGTVFAHIHPTGTVSMAAFMLANPQQSMKDMPGMAGMPMDGSALPNVVAFPYGFPSAGTYRIFVQMKHGTTVETGAFDVTVTQS